MTFESKYSRHLGLIIETKFSHRYDNTCFRLSRDQTFIPRLGISGRDMGRDMPILGRTADFLVFKTVGHTAWGGVGITSYYPPCYYFIRYRQHEVIEGLYRIVKVYYEVEASKKNWREVKEFMLEQLAKFETPIQ